MNSGPHPVILRVQAAARSYSGRMPPPGSIRMYAWNLNSQLSGIAFAQRIVTLAREMSESRHRFDKDSSEWQSLGRVESVD